MSNRMIPTWVKSELELHVYSFDEGQRAAAQVISEADLTNVPNQGQDLPLYVLDTLRSESQGTERQLNSNPAFIFGALTAAFQKLGYIPLEIQHV
jgi:hypothetical protein